LDPHDSSINKMWSATLVPRGELVSAVSLTYNSVIYPNAVTSFGFCANKTGPDYAPEVVQALSP
jgi:cellulase/cellobiase CelA1